MSKKSLILVAALAIALVGCNKEKEEANVPVIGEQQEQQAAAQVQQNTSADMQQHTPVAAPEAPVATPEAPVAAPEAPVATQEASTATQEAPIAPSTLVVSNDSAAPANLAK